MRVALVYDSLFPVQHYGGTERVVWWLAKGLASAGVTVTLVCREGSQCPFAKVLPTTFFSEKMFDLIHYFNTPDFSPSKPYIVTIGGNAKAGESFLPNTVFVSRNHAERHGAVAFVYNGLDPDEYEFNPSTKNGSLLFLAKASWRVKNVAGAIRIARKSRRELNIVGGERKFFRNWRGIHWRGMLGGEEKTKYISRAKGLLFPVLWDEPFGIAVAEALVCGTPVLATPYGSLPELLNPEVGRLCHNDDEFTDGVAALESFSPEKCRDYVLENLTYVQMRDKYLRYYERVLSGERLNPTAPFANQPQGTIRKYPVP